MGCMHGGSVDDNIYDEIGDVRAWDFVGEKYYYVLLQRNRPILQHT